MTRAAISWRKAWWMETRERATADAEINPGIARMAADTPRTTLTVDTDTNTLKAQLGAHGLIGWLDKESDALTATCYTELWTSI